MNNISDKERFVLLVSASLFILLYSVFGIFQSAVISPIVKVGPFLIISLYVFIRTYFSGKNKKKG